MPIPPTDGPPPGSDRGRGEDTDGGVDECIDAPIDTPPTGPPLERHELFTLLGNPTRIQILEALWDAFDYSRYVTDTQVGIGFSDLRADASIADSGNFNYHLEKLTGDLIEKRADGYVLSPLGFNLMRSITTYEGFEYRTLPGTPLEDDCPFCGGRLVASYERELVQTECEDCGGLAHGTIGNVHLPVTEIGVVDVGRVLDAATLRLQSRVEHASYGVCWRCQADIEPEIEVCTDHDPAPDGVCRACENRYRASFGIDCAECQTAGLGPLVEVALVSPIVAGFFADHDAGRRSNGAFRYRLDGFASIEEAVTRVDPPAIRYHVTWADDTISVELRPDTDGIEVARV